jgi:hypothetical protein
MNTEHAKNPPYFSLRWGLGMLDEAKAKIVGSQYGYCSKLYTTRTHRLSGEYYVVEGSRYKSKAVEPRIEFKVTISEELDLKRGIFKKGDTICGWAIANRNALTYPELDIGVTGTTFLQLRDELLRLNKKATIETPFFVNVLEPI